MRTSNREDMESLIPKRGPRCAPARHGVSEDLTAPARLRSEEAVRTAFAAAGGMAPNMLLGWLREGADDAAEEPARGAGRCTWERAIGGAEGTKREKANEFNGSEQ